MAKIRTCLVCGTKYKYCNTCGDYNPEETWRFVFHEEKCRDIYDIWQQYHSKQISLGELKNALKGFDLAVVLSDETNTMISSDIKNAFLDKKEDVEPVKEEVAVEQPKKNGSIKKAEEFVNVDKKYNNHNKNNSDKKNK